MNEEVLPVDRLFSLVRNNIGQLSVTSCSRAKSRCSVELVSLSAEAQARKGEDGLRRRSEITLQ